MTQITASRPVVSRFDTIDILRGLSILAVMFLHVFIHLYIVGFHFGAALLTYPFHVIIFNGGNGVTLFFTISGFLITLTSLRRFGGLDNMRPAVFYRIRFARIAPLLLLLLTVLSILHLANVPGFHINPKVATLPRALFSALTFHLNWLEGVRRAYLPANWDVLWSLSIEEMFYVFFPLLTFFLCRFKFGRYLFIALLLALICMGPFARTVWTEGNPIWRDNTYLGGMDSIALGCLTAMLVNRIQLGKLRTPPKYILLGIQILGAAILCLIAVYPHWHWMTMLGRSGAAENLLALGSCCVLAASVLRNKLGSRFTAPLRWLGRHSYEIYLTHCFFVIIAIALYTHLHPAQNLYTFALWCISVIACSAALGGLVAHFFSEPMNRRLRGAAPPTHQPIQYS